MTETLDERARLQAEPLTFGVGARVTIAVMADRYAEIILDAIGTTDARGLILDTTDVSTYAGGSEAALLRWITDLSEAVANSGQHASISVHLSRGCPGEVACELPGGAGPRSTDVPAGRVTGQFATAEWALYPLADQVVQGVEPDHMRDIYAAIEFAKNNGTFRRSEHFVTRLEGDLGQILETVIAGWVMVGRSVQHVTSHLTISLNSPSHPKAVGDDH